jgi:leucyl-tRNA synthetase
MSETTVTSNPARKASDEPAYRYTAALAAEIEARWQGYWQREGTFRTPNPVGALGPANAAEEERLKRDKLFVMDMFPYPSGSGLHVGHPLGYIATDVFSRYQRMAGRNVLHTLGFDAFGLPAEQYAVETGTHPRVTTERNIERYREQIGRIGFDHDTRRTLATTDVAFYRWTQWIFLRVFNSWYDEVAGRARPIHELIAEFAEGRRATPDGRPWDALSGRERADVIDAHRLAYKSEAPVNWCPGLGTVLANEEVTADGRSERGNFPVFKRKLSQWMMRITAYADRLLSDLDELDWPEPIKLMQRNWIGRSEGARVTFQLPIAGGPVHPIEIFTTRPDTLFGATYVVLAPEHPLVDVIVPDAWPEGTREAWTGEHATPRDAVADYRARAAAKTEMERQAEGRQKTGVFTGAYAVNPVNDERVPVFVADYVLMGYGTGAIMAVPAHDHRDFEFARVFDLPMRCVVRPTDERGTDTATWNDAFVSYDAPIMDSANAELSLDGLAVPEAKRRIIDWLAEAGIGQGKITYKLRDWLFSRQRYWGEPFPIVYDENNIAIALPESMLPIELPEVDDYSPKSYAPDDRDSEPEPPLSRARDWVEVTLDLGEGPKRYRRETNTMPQWAGSCWYYLRYLDPSNTERFADPEVERYWLAPRAANGDDPGRPGGVDLYVGGAEHAVLHLLYARFWHKVLFDLGLVSSNEPFHKLFNQGMIQGYAYIDARGMYVPAAEVEERDGGYYYRGERVTRVNGKMGKSLKNAIAPDDIYDTYGADTLRLYEMSMGPLDVSRPWEDRAVIGPFRLLQRVWRNIVDEHTGATVVTDEPADEETLKALHRTIDALRGDYENLRFNTAVAKLTDLNNRLTRLPAVPRPVAEALTLMLAPLAPHIAEELWSRLGHEGSLAYESFPSADPAYLVRESVTCVVQVAGKVRDRLSVSPDIAEDALRDLALSSEAVSKALAGRGVRTVVVRAPKLVNVVPS